MTDVENWQSSENIHLQQPQLEHLIAEDNEMSSEGKKDKKLKKSKDREPSKEQQYAINLAHFCVVSYVVIIFYLCFKYEFVFFTWHPLLLVIGWGCTILESVLALLKDNHFTRELSGTVRLRIHWILQVIGLTTSLIGCIVVFINKNRLNKSHFHSWHGLFGLIAMIALIPANLNGIPTLYKRDLINYCSPKLIKLVHVLSGVIAVIFGGLTLILSVCTKWFGRNTQHNSFIFYFALFCTAYPIVFGLLKPIKTCYRIIRIHLLAAEDPRTD